MGIETFNYIDSLNTANPTSTDNVSEGDDHIRGIKTTLKNTFPSLDGAVNATDTELNLLDGITALIDSTGSTGAAKLPAGTTAQRDGSPSAGYLRWNTTDTSAEVYDGSAWAAVGGGNTTDEGLYEHSHTISANYSITSGNNALTAGPITINTGVSVTVPTGSTWVIA
jgi:hypothetical protein